MTSRPKGGEPANGEVMDNGNDNHRRGEGDGMMLCGSVVVAVRGGEVVLLLWRWWK